MGERKCGRCPGACVSANAPPSPRGRENISLLSSSAITLTAEEITAIEALEGREMDTNETGEEL
jgi:hypothetical protein